MSSIAAAFQALIAPFSPLRRNRAGGQDEQGVVDATPVTEEQIIAATIVATTAGTGTEAATGTEATAAMATVANGAATVVAATVATAAMATAATARSRPTGGQRGRKQKENSDGITVP